MARVPFGEWKPSTEEEDERDTDFSNPALQAEAQRDAQSFLEGITEAEPYEVGGQAQSLDPRIVRGLLDAKKEGE